MRPRTRRRLWFAATGGLLVAALDFFAGYTLAGSVLCLAAFVLCAGLAAA